MAETKEFDGMVLGWGKRLKIEKQTIIPQLKNKKEKEVNKKSSIHLYQNISKWLHSFSFPNDWKQFLPLEIYPEDKILNMEGFKYKMMLSVAVFKIVLETMSW